MFTQASATTAMASSTAALPVSVRRNTCSGVCRFRAHAVRSANGCPAAGGSSSAKVEELLVEAAELARGVGQGPSCLTGKPADANTTLSFVETGKPVATGSNGDTLHLTIKVNSYDPQTNGATFVLQSDLGNGAALQENLWFGAIGP